MNYPAPAPRIHLRIGDQKGFANIILIIIMMAVAGAAGYYFLSRGESPSVNLENSQNDNVSNSIEGTSGWEMYSNAFDKISFKFPTGFKKEFETKTQSKTQQAFFTDYKGEKPFGFFDLPPKGGSHIGYVSLPYDKAEVDRFIASEGSISKKEISVMNLPATRLENDGPTNTGDPTLVEKEITYIFHDEGRTYSLFIEYFKGSPDAEKWVKDFETMIKTVTRYQSNATAPVPPKQSNTDVKIDPVTEQAKDFSLKIVKTYFDKDCNTYYGALANTIYTLEDEGPIQKNSEIKVKLCDSISQAVEGQHTFQDYLNSYNFTVLSKAEYEVDARFRFIKNLKNFKTTSNDYLFVGYEVKTGQNNFMWDDMLIFMVRKTSSGWEISAGSG